mgnify:FL=1
MSTIRTLLRTYGTSLRQLIRFGFVGGLGVLVNMAVMVVAAKAFPLLWESAAIPEGEGVWWSIPGTEYNIRWYHIMTAVAFLVANLFNFQLNRWWTFRSHRHAGWFREYWPFLTVGLVALAIGQVIITALMHPHSIIALPTEIFDGSTGFRSRHYWANLISIACTIPVSFIVNKFWTFRSVRESAEDSETCISNN